jgi:hypothetical protein
MMADILLVQAIRTTILPLQSFHYEYRVGNDTLAWFQSLSTQVSSSHIFGTLGIPATSGLAIGLVVGLAKS